METDRTLNEDQGFTTTVYDRVELETGGILISEDGQFAPSDSPLILHRVLVVE